MESDVYVNLRNKTGFTAKDLMEYLFLDSMRERKNAKILVGMDSGLINIGLQNSP